jgi:hypothetical protein
VQQNAMAFRENYQWPALHKKSMLTGHGGFPIGYLLQVWPSARNPQFFINASNAILLDF